MSTEALANITPVNPPAVNRNKKPIAKIILVVALLEPPYAVAIHEKIFIPVGTAITIVAAVKYALVSTSNPTVYMWWLQTTNPNTPIDIMAYTIPKYPNTALPEFILIAWDTIPNAGTTKM